MQTRQKLEMARNGKLAHVRGEVVLRRGGVMANKVHARMVLVMQTCWQLSRVLMRLAYLKHFAGTLKWNQEVLYDLHSRIKEVA